MLELEQVNLPGKQTTAASRVGRVSIVMPVLNQLSYTQGCLQSLKAELEAGVELIIIDNGSTDGTPQFLASLTGVRIITNNQNRGCAAGWNQGVEAATREWVVMLNNDVIVAPGWLESLVSFAEKEKLGVVTPGIREGPLNYSFADYAADYLSRMREKKRIGAANGICFMVHRSVFKKIGTFDEGFRIGGFEDADFFMRAKLAGFQLGTTGSAFLHHFGSITQIAVRKTPVANSYGAENRAYFRKKWGLTAPRRLWQRFTRLSRNAWWRFGEQLTTGHSLHEKWVDGKIRRA